MTATALRNRFGTADAVLVVGALAMASAQIAIPLTATTPFLSTVTVVGMGVCAFGGAWRAWGARAALVTLLATGSAALLVEILGSRTGFPFGAYSYSGALTPTVLGVPLIVPVAWFAMGTAAWATAAWISTRRWIRILLGALALTAWDLFLDPQMVDAGFWQWETDAWLTYRGIPVVNYLGWFLTALVVVAIVDRVAGPDRSAPLLGLYTWMAVMQTLGFVVFFGDPVVGVVGGTAMLPFVGLAWWRKTRG